MGLRAACPKCGDIGVWSLTYCVCKKCDSTILIVDGEAVLQNTMRALNYLIEKRERRLTSLNLSATELREAFEKAKSCGVFDEETNAGRARIDRFCETIIRQYKYHNPKDELTRILISKLEELSEEMPSSSSLSPYKILTGAVEQQAKGSALADRLERAFGVDWIPTQEDLLAKDWRILEARSDQKPRRRFNFDDR